MKYGERTWERSQSRLISEDMLPVHNDALPRVSRCQAWFAGIGHCLQDACSNVSAILCEGAGQAQKLVRENIHILGRMLPMGSSYWIDSASYTASSMLVISHYTNSITPRTPAQLMAYVNATQNFFIPFLGVAYAAVQYFKKYLEAPPPILPSRTMGAIWRKTWLIAASLGVPVFLLLAFVLPPIYRLVGVNADVVSNVRRYAIIYGLSAPAALQAAFAQAMLYSVGSRFSLGLEFIVNAAWAAFTILFIKFYVLTDSIDNVGRNLGFTWLMRNVGLVITASAAIWWVLKTKARETNFGHLEPNFLNCVTEEPREHRAHHVRGLLKNGWSYSLTLAFQFWKDFIATLLVASLGEDSQAVHGVVRPFYFILHVTGIVLYQIMQQRFNRRDQMHISYRHSYWAGKIVSMLLAAPFIWLGYRFATQITRLLLANTEHRDLENIYHLCRWGLPLSLASSACELPVNVDLALLESRNQRRAYFWAYIIALATELPVAYLLAHRTPLGVNGIYTAHIILMSLLLLYLFPRANRLSRTNPAVLSHTFRSDSGAGSESLLRAVVDQDYGAQGREDWPETPVVISP